MSPKRPPAALRILPIVRLLAAIRALPEIVSNLIAARPELIRGSLTQTQIYMPCKTSNAWVHRLQTVATRPGLFCGIRFAGNKADRREPSLRSVCRRKGRMPGRRFRSCRTLASARCRGRPPVAATPQQRVSLHQDNDFHCQDRTRSIRYPMHRNSLPTGIDRCSSRVCRS